MKPKVLSVDLPRIDGDTQSRVAINEDVVADYAEIIGASGTEWPFPPLDVFFDGAAYWIADGFHRFLAAHRAKRGSIPCNIHQGTAKDARIFGMTANDQHGLRMSREDKRSNIEWLLDNGGKMTQQAVAEKAGASVGLVQTVLAERNPVSIRGKAKAPQLGVQGLNEPNTPISGGNGRKPAASAPAAPPAPEPEQDLGKCPNCLGTKWAPDEYGMACVKCHHPWGEPAGDVDGENVKTQRQKLIKTIEALMRAFDDLHALCPKPCHKECIATCKDLLKAAREWKLP